jgi:5-methylcytosine-specific restriction endonuclease McrA
MRAAAQQRSRDWHAANRDAANEARRDWHYANRLRALSTMADWTQRNPEKKRIIRKRRRAAKMGCDEHYTLDQLACLWASAGGRCACCRTRITLKTRQVDHIEALAAGGSNAISNIQFLCERCNKSKGARDPLIFMRSRGLLL